MGFNVGEQGAILVGDIGGTHARIALFREGKLWKETLFSSPKFQGLEEILKTFLNSHSVPIEAACFGVAGRVEGGSCVTTNLPWKVHVSSLCSCLSLADVFLVNDLFASAWSIREDSSECFTLRPKKTKGDGNKALVMVGTGLGKAGLVIEKGSYIPFPSEGGHVEWAPRNRDEMELWEYLQGLYKHVSCERVLSGEGLFDIYSFLLKKEGKTIPREWNEEIEKKGKGEMIASHSSDPLCRKALDWFVSLYGSELGNTALQFFATSGVFVAGGIALALRKGFQSQEFEKSFLDKGRFAQFLEQIPLYLVLDKTPALRGAYLYAMAHKNTKKTG